MCLGAPALLILICVFVCICIHGCAYMHVCTHTEHAYMYVCVYAHTCINVCVYAHTQRTCIHVRVCVCVCVCGDLYTTTMWKRHLPSSVNNSQVHVSQLMPSIDTDKLTGSV